MQFQYRAVDERRSRSPPPPAVPSTPGSGSADSHGSGGRAERVGDSAVTLWQPNLPPPETAAVDADELRRQTEKARIRERILREEAEHWELELEVRSELREQMLRQSWPVLGRSARGSDTPAALSTGTITAANSSLPVVTPEAHPKANTLATAPTKRKSPDRATGALLAPSSKKQKNTLTCMVCGITTNSEKAMQGHLNGKVRKRKVVALPELPKLVAETEERGLEAGEEEAMSMETLGDYKPTKFMMATTAGELNEVTQMDGCATATHTVRRLEGFLLCELCDVKAASMHGMRQHLSGKKHKNKANTSSDASVNVSTGGKEAAKAKSIDTDTAVISDMVAKVEAPLEKSLQPKLGDDGEVQEVTVAPPKDDVATGDSAKPVGTEVMKSSATSAGAQLNNACNSDLLTMEVDSVMHPLSRVDGLFICLSCNAKATSEAIMRSHLAGKKHKRKMTFAARGNNDLCVLATKADEVQDNSSKSTKANVEAGLVPSAVPQANTAADKEESAPSLATPQTKNTVAMASMAVDRPAEAQLDTCVVGPTEDCEITEEAEGEHAAAGSNGSVTQTKESVRTNDTTAVPGKPIKIQVEGKVFTVTQQENGSLSCEVCAVHGYDKDSMILHLYTSTHWGKASLAEKKEKEQACMVAVAMVNKDSEVGSMAS
ncbi:unnamed protein product [Miscanthus lutarioriparius]|uniref:C2H2-type domain-containing protein n=1 Tax=Miscanthus lutarioriparius TaxID=422564 RepID=A0A811QU57_9POAL|nr:unnamed protein product [Miscanthus lutarioriparius]